MNAPVRLRRILLVAAALCGNRGRALEPIPDRLVVLTFDDAVKSHYCVARQLLKKYQFGATFFVTEGLGYKTNPGAYMTWQEIRALYDDGFEIGNHTRDHMGVNAGNAARLEEQLAYIARQCQAVGIPKPISFAWPGNFIALEGLPVLKKHGIVFGRRGGSPEYATDTGLGFAFEPGLDDPLLIPSAGVPRPGWTLQTFADAVGKARNGRIAVIQFHGVPEIEHPWVHTPAELFEQYMQYLQANGYRAIALRDLARYIDPAVAPADRMAIIHLRQKMLSLSRH